LLGNGDGTFQEQKEYSVSERPNSAIIADVNGDGKPDLIVEEYTYNPSMDTAGAVGVLLGNGDGTFGPEKTFTLGQGPNGITVADVNGDGFPDIIVANRYPHYSGMGTVSVLLGNGDGTFQKQSTIDVGGNPRSVVVGDASGDRRPDLVVTNFADETLGVLRGNGDGTFQVQQTFAVGRGPSAAVLADVNGDGRPDLVDVNSGDGTVSVLLGNGDGTFLPAKGDAGPGVRTPPYLADFSKTGIRDSIILDGSGNILFRKGVAIADTEFAPPVTVNAAVADPMTGMQQELRARDVTLLNTTKGLAIATADAIPDPVILAQQQTFVYTVSLYTYGNGSFTRPSGAPAFYTPLLPTRVIAGDLIGNGLDDIVVANALDNSIQVSFQQADGTFLAPLTFPVGITPSDIAVVDVNGDGMLDIVVTDQGSGDVTVLLNDDSHSFTTVERFRAGIGPYGVDANLDVANIASLTQPVSLAAGDFTGTGRNDLLVVDQETQSYSILQNDGTGGFHEPQAALNASINGGAGSSEKLGPVVAGDFNGDGKLDFAVLLEDSDQVWIFTGDGNGHFAHTFSIAAGSAPAGLNAVRNKQSGLLDLVVGNSFGDVLILHGNGDGTFAPPPPLTGDSAPLDVQKLQGSVPDILVANQKTNTITVQTPLSDGATYTPVLTLANESKNDLAPDAVQWAKLEGNSGLFDAVVTASGSNSILIYRTISVDPVTGKPTFAAPVAYPVGEDPVAVTIKDINGDGIPDLLVSNKGADDISTLFGALDSNGNWIGIPGPRLNSGGDGPVAVNLISDSQDPAMSDLFITNSQDGSFAVLPGRGLGFFDDRTPTLLTIPGEPVIGAPTFLDSTGDAVVTTSNGLLIGFNVYDFNATVHTILTAGPVLEVLRGANTEQLVALMQRGGVTLMQLNNTLQQVRSLQPLTAFDGVPQNPSNFAVVENDAGLQVIVSNRGEDQLFVFKLESIPEGPVLLSPTQNQGPGGGPGGSPEAPEPNGEGPPGSVLQTITLPPPIDPGVTVEATTPAEATFALVVTLVAANLSAAPSDLATVTPETDAGLSTGLDGDAYEANAIENDSLRIGDFGLGLDESLRKLDLGPPLMDGPASPSPPELPHFEAPSPENNMPPLARASALWNLQPEYTGLLSIQQLEITASVAGHVPFPVTHLATSSGFDGELTAPNPVVVSLVDARIPRETGCFVGEDCALDQANVRVQVAGPGPCSTLTLASGGWQSWRAVQLLLVGCSFVWLTAAQQILSSARNGNDIDERLRASTTVRRS
jgi:hypothetical protein